MEKDKGRCRWAYCQRPNRNAVAKSNILHGNDWPTTASFTQNTYQLWSNQSHGAMPKSKVTGRTRTSDRAKIKEYAYEKPFCMRQRSEKVTVAASNTGQACFKCPEPVSELQPVICDVYACVTKRQ
eukprot:4629827-Pleurochrysis_carterae.AAC.2